MVGDAESRAELGESLRSPPAPLLPFSLLSLRPLLALTARRDGRFSSREGAALLRDAQLGKGKGKSAGAAEAGPLQSHSHSSAFPAALPVGKDRQGNAGCEMLLLQQLGQGSSRHCSRKDLGVLPLPAVFF